MFLLRKPSALFAFEEMCVSHDMSEEMLTPRYFAEDTDSSMQKSVLYRNKFLVTDFIKRLAEVKQNEISLLFLIDGFEIIDQHEELEFTRALLSEAMLELIEDI